LNPVINGGITFRPEAQPVIITIDAIVIAILKIFISALVLREIDLLADNNLLISIFSAMPISSD